VLELLELQQLHELQAVFELVQQLVQVLLELQKQLLDSRAALEPLPPEYSVAFGHA
jgi:hypothetical protein